MKPDIRLRVRLDSVVLEPAALRLKAIRGYTFATSSKGCPCAEGVWERSGTFL